MFGKKSAVILLMLLSHGCIMWDAGYTDNAPVTNHGVSPNNQFPVAYDISIKFERNDFSAAPDRKELMKKVESALNATGLFSLVSYGEKGGEDSYHISFSFHQAGIREHESVGWALLSGYSLLTIPYAEIATFDGVATLSLKGEAIYSTAKAEELRCFVWLPVLPLGFFMNEWSAWHYVEKGIINALVNDISDFHKKRFLNDVEVKVIKE